LEEEATWRFSSTTAQGFRGGFRVTLGIIF
jgi:hypothetical protein